MSRFQFLLLTGTFRCLLMVLTTNFALAQHTPDDETLRELRSAHEQLATSLEEVRASVSDLTLQQQQLFADAAVFPKAAEWMLRHDEFFRKGYDEALRGVLAEGETRVSTFRDAVAGRPVESTNQAGSRVHAYVSRVDSSVQPYAVLLPDGHVADSQRYPLHVVLHGRAAHMNEVDFIRRHLNQKPSDDQDWIQLDVYGRGNNAYRWAGETDVFEAMQDLMRRYRIDDKRITLRGFSMGGAGAWHLGMHHPDRWCSVGAGAGFVDFYKYQKRSEQLPPWQHRTLGIYDAVDYAMSASNVPVCTYGGENDPQLLAGQTMTKAAAELGIDIELIIGPEMGHKFDPDSRARFMAFHQKNSKNGRPGPFARKSIRFTTRTLKYNRCDWITIEEMRQQYEPAVVQADVNAEGDVEIRTKNITAFRVFRDIARDAIVDGVRLPCRAAADGLLPDVYYLATQDGWEVLDYDQSRGFSNNNDLHKRHQLQGPIDDAFMSPFLCVVGTGTPWHKAVHEQALAELERLRKTHDKWMRGNTQIVNDVDLTDDQVRDFHLILFGDPGSNRILSDCLSELPLKWTRESLQIGARQWSSDEHLPQMIYPNPLNPAKYVVINSGFTVRDVDFRASNSWLFPKLGDIAVRRIANRVVEPEIDDWSDVVWADTFNSFWQLQSATER